MRCLSLTRFDPTGKLMSADHQMRAWIDLSPDSVGGKLGALCSAYTGIRTRPNPTRPPRTSSWRWRMHKLHRVSVHNGRTGIQGCQLHEDRIRLMPRIASICFWQSVSCACRR